jgi:hypothetical protein
MPAGTAQLTHRARPVASCAALTIDNQTKERTMDWLVLDAASSYDKGASFGDKVHPYFWPVVAIVLAFVLVRWFLKRRRTGK